MIRGAVRLAQATRRDAPLWARLLVALLASAAALSLSHLIPGTTRAGLFLPLVAVILSAWFGGFRAGVAATIACIVGGSLILPGAGTEGPVPSPLWSLFAVVALALSALGATERRARRRAEASAQEAARERAGRHEAEETQRANEEGLRLALGNLPVCLVAFDARGEVLVWNQECERVTGYGAAEMIGNPHALRLLFPEPAYRASLGDHFGRQADYRGFETRVTARDGSPRVMAWSNHSARFPIPGWASWGIGVDLTEVRATEARLREESQTLETLHYVGQLLSAELDLQKLVQAVTDAAVELTGARMGAFFYNVIDRGGESYRLYALSGVDRERFGGFEMPRNTELFGPTFRGDAVVRVDDVRKDPRYGRNPPHHGLPEGHAPVVSYLAVPVVSRSGETIGGLFLGHEEVGVFSERDERLVVGLAAQAAVAVDNARLFDELQRARSAAEQSERRYRELAEAVPQIAWSARADGSLEYLNQRWCDYTGLTIAESLGWGWRRAVHSEDLHAGLARWRGALGAGETLELEARLRRADGAYRWHLTRALPMRGPDGAIARWFGTSVDIDDRKRAEDEMRFLARASDLLASSLDSEATLASLARLAVPRIADWCVVDVVEGPRIRRLSTGHADPAKARESEEYAREHPLSLSAEHPIAEAIQSGQPRLHPQLPEPLLAAVAREPVHFAARRGTGLRSAMIVPLVARGRTLGAITFVAAESGRVYGPADLAFTANLASRAAVAVDNARLYREAQEANRTKDEFLATLSHELRTPLTAIVGWSQMLRSGRLDPATAARAVETIDRNARAQTQLINDILDVSRIVTGKLRLNVRAVDLGPVVDAAVEAVRPAAEARGITIETSLEAAGGPVSGDPDRLQQVIWNLLSNAIKFTPRGGVVTVRLARSEGHMEISVADTGVGIDAEFLPYVFERFRQGDASSTRSHGGLGLGLAIVRHLVELHGGTVKAESAGPNRGSQFSVQLPVIAATAADERRAAPEPALRGAAPGLEGVRVLLVEDDGDARELLRTLLRQRGAEVIVVASGADAVEAIPRVRPDVLLCDIEMPGENGYSVIRRVRALPADQGGRTPAAAITAYARTEDRMQALLSGFQIHVPKPVQAEELAAVVASLSGRMAR